MNYSVLQAESKIFLGFTRADPEIFKREGAVCRPKWLVGEENFIFQMVQRGRNNVRNYKSFWQDISISIFKFSPFLLIESYHFFQNLQTL